jgi:Protein phosphatase 2C
MWKALGASVTGNSHVVSGTGCQDASGWRTHAGVTCLAVADGAGSRPLSATGSALAVEQALETVARLASDENSPGDLTDWLRAAFDSARDRVAAFASSTEREPGDYAATLAVAILAADHIAIGQIGDGITVVGHGGHYIAVHPEIKGEYVNETFFLTASDWYEHLRLTVLAGAADVVALSTDGLRYKITNTRTGAPFEPFFDGLLGYVQGAEASSDGISRFLAGLENDQTGDDKSLVAAVQVTVEASVPGDHGETWPARVHADTTGQPPPLPVTAPG